MLHTMLPCSLGGPVSGSPARRWAVDVGDVRDGALALCFRMPCSQHGE